MLQVSRDNNLKIPKKIENTCGVLNNSDDKLKVKEALATANDLKFNYTEVKNEVLNDKELELVNKIPINSNDLIVITTLKKLIAYIIAITEKSPAKFRGVFVNRMQNLSLDALENLLNANFIRLDSVENKKQREEFQKQAIIKLKMLGYISLVAKESNCILMRQYKQIALQIGETINLISSWKKSDDYRFKR